MEKWSRLEVAQEHFAFQTAESDNRAGGGADARLDKLEATLASLQSSLAQLVAQEAPPDKKKEKGQVGGQPKPAPQPRKERASTARPGKSSKPEKIPSLDDSTCQAAIAAGVPVEHLKEMGVILQHKPKRLDDLPRGEITRREAGPLDETEDEDEEPELVPAGEESGHAAGVEKAIVQLTKIATRLTEPKKDWFESLVEGGSGSASSSGDTGAPSSRRNAAAMRALQKSLVERPKQIYQSIEANLASDFMSRAVVPGEPFAAGATTRGWLTSRSRIQNYTNQVRWSWQVCGIWDCLIAGRHEEASARCAVLIAASDQSSILASSALLEATTPFPGLPEPQSPQVARVAAHGSVGTQVGRSPHGSSTRGGYLHRVQEEAGRKDQSWREDGEGARGGGSSASSGQSQGQTGTRNATRREGDKGSRLDKTRPALLVDQGGWVVG